MKYKFIIVYVLFIIKLNEAVTVSDCHASMYGCCPDGISPADGPNLENCNTNKHDSLNNSSLTQIDKSCETSEYGCCSDFSLAKGPNKEGCIDYSCRDSEFGCCDDLVTPAKAEDLNDCPSECIHSSYGCCTDGKTASRGPGHAGCINKNETNFKTKPCAETEYGCCSDEITIALSPLKENCLETSTESQKIIESSTIMEIIDESINQLNLKKHYNNHHHYLESCVNTPHECCPDGVSVAIGPQFEGCQEQKAYASLFKNMKKTKEENTCLLGEPEKNCYNYTLKWRYEAKEGRCVQFWYGGCDGNSNLFSSNEECEGKCIKPNGTDVCKLPLINSFSQCQNNVTRYYYDFKSSSCKQFIYSGCFGNANNFETLEECENRCQIPLLFEQCSFIPDKGPCMGNYDRWYFDSKSGVCKKFIYGGCIRNKNNHMLESDCIDSCVRPKQKSVCLLPKIVGNCDQRLHLWYYDFKEGKCKSMVYSGCNGNLNRFETLEACEYTCQGLNEPTKQISIINDICHAPKITGMCHLDLQRWYFNKTTQMCHQFTYSGCDGNSNSFESENDCRQTCNAKEIDPCALPLDHGTCDKYKIYWYFNQVDRECVRFYYGGCDGNQNRFENRENCEITCKMSKEEKEFMLKLPKQCILPLEYGSSCDPITPKWYFDIQSKLCYPFEYSGCGPELANRFSSNEECNKFCAISNLNNTNYNLLQVELTDIKTTTDNPTSTFKHVSALDSSKLNYDLCDLPVAKGNCSQKVTKWFFDNKVKYCRQFEFSGCNGNENRFETRHQCTEICETPKRREICNSNKVQGPCHEYRKRWYLDTETRSCKQFMYGGCLGNENNFETNIECRNFCWDYLSDEAKSNENLNLETGINLINSTTAQNDHLNLNQIDVCSLRKDEGKFCANLTERWYFDQKIEACLKFSYNGCNGNGNNFESRSKCEEKCSRNSFSVLDISPTNNENPCEAPNEILAECINENTNDILPSKLNNNNLVWYYDIESRSCRSIAHDCIRQSKPNRFNSYNLCKSQCIPNITEQPTQNDCLLPMEIGNKCNHQIWRWYYDSAAGECYLFSYSGCDGNNNNFATSKDCLWLCAAVGDHKCPSLENCNEKCKYGRVKSLNNCELCECFNPCEHLKCKSNEECVVENQIPLCRSKNKPGQCPIKSLVEEKLCASRCNSDVDCSLDQKCCPNSCSATHCVSPSFDQDPEIVEFVSRIELLEGDKLLLPCKVTGKPMPNVTWYKNHHEITFSQYDNRLIFEQENNSLIITNVNEKDEAIYSCRAVSRTGKAVVKESNVFINIPPYIKKTSQEKYELFGSDAMINCNIFGRPHPKFEWHFGPNLIKPNPFKYALYSNILIIKRFDFNDVGRYKCTGTNGFGSSVSVNITLHRAIPGEVKFSLINIEANLNSHTILNCNHVGTPKPNITWTTPHNQLISINHQNYNKFKYELINETSLRINLIEMKDAGSYRCSALNHYSYSYLKRKQGTVILTVRNQSIEIKTTESTTLSTTTELTTTSTTSTKKYNNFSTVKFKSETFYFNQTSQPTINCTIDEIDNTESLNKIWFRNGLSIRRYDSRYSILQNGSIVIHKLKHNEDSQFTCLLVNTDNITLANLNFNVKTLKRLIYKNFTINVNQSVPTKLDCLLENNLLSNEHIIKINWMFNNQSNLNHKNSTLELDNLQQNQSGIYECLAETNLNNYLTIIDLKINEINSTFEFKHMIVRASKEKSIVLDCTWWFNKDNLLFNNLLSNNLTEWRLNGSIIDEKKMKNNDKYEYLDTYNTLLKINKLKLEENNDLYSCTFRQKDIKQSNFSLFIGVGPFVDDENIELNNTIKWYNKYESANLDCPIIGSPAPNLTWSFNSSAIKEEDNFKYQLDPQNFTLKILELDESSQGVYLCNATNEFGSAFLRYKVQIAKPMYIIEPIKNILTVKKYENVLIKCEYNGGKPKPIISWLFNGILLNILNNQKYSADQNILSIKNVSAYDSGTYTCVLSNGFHKQVNFNYTLNVLEQPIITFEPESPIYEAGSKAVIKCNVESKETYSNHQISWVRNANKLQNTDKYNISGEYLIINPIGVEDAGKYICKVTIGQSVAKKHITVKVYETDLITDCEDTSSYTHCKLVAIKGLCSKWGKFCCKTCKEYNLKYSINEKKKKHINFI